ncbi:MAG: hypothetical protein JWO35_68 [Candidatus Saccharibacteria bacterium]|nr:hypothetical protein [Candidatus Saccharibacteria bacterium]
MATTNASKDHREYEPDIDADIPGLHDDLRQRENGGISDDDLRDITGINPEQEDEMGRRAESGAAEDTAARENSFGRTREGAESEAGAGSIFNADGDKGGRFANVKGKLGRFSKNKWLVGGMAGGGAGIVALVLLLVLLAGSLKIPNLAEHITTYAFTRVLRQSGETTRRLTYQKLAIDALDKNTGYVKAKTAYQNTRNNTWGKLDKYRPEKVITNLGTNNNFKLNYDNPTITGKRQLKSVTLASQDYNIKKQPYTTRYIPGISQRIEFKNRTQFAKAFAPALNDSLKADNIGPIIRGKVAAQIRKELGIGLVAWNVGKYKGKSEAKARLVLEREARSKIAANGTQPALSKSTQQAIDDADKAAKETIQNDEDLKRMIANGGSDPKVQEAIEKSVTPNNASKALSIVNPVFGPSLAVCIVYDGSLTNSGPTINNATASQQKSYYFLSSAADQQKYGDTTGEAVGATNDKLGDITTSNPEVRASGGKVDTSSSLSSQASAGGELSIVNILPGGSTVEGAFKAACPTLTDPYFAGAAAIVLAGLSLNPATGAARAAGTQAVEGVTKSLTSRFVARLTTKEGLSTTAENARFIAKDTIKSGAKVGAATIAAKLIVMSKAAQLNTGLEQGQDFANMADSGGNIAANEIEQRQFYGRPLKADEIVQNKDADLAFLSEQTSKQPFTERYFAVSNPNSLINRFAITTASAVNNSFFSSFLSLGSKLFTPLSSMNNMLGSLVKPQAVSAITYNNATDDYGNVQWGYSDDEMRLLSLNGDNGDYSPLENQVVLDKSGKEDEINEKYKSCFDGSKKIGDMLAEGMIVRDEKGNLLNDDDITDDKAICSPNDLGLENDTYGNNMVFRWRVAHNYSNGLDHLIDQQDITADSSMASIATPADDGSSVSVSGDAKQVAQEILANKNITYIFSAKEDVQLAAQGKAGTNGAPIDIRGLQLVAALGKKHKIVVSAYESHGQGHSAGSDHYSGHAVDIANIDGKLAFINITDYYSEFKEYAKGAVFLQGNCVGAKPAPSGMNRQPGDTCNHQHISFN